MQERCRIVPRLIHALAFCALSLALAVPGAHAAERKKAGAKKPAATATAKQQQRRRRGPPKPCPAGP